MTDSATIFFLFNIFLFTLWFKYSRQSVWGFGTQDSASSDPGFTDIVLSIPSARDGRLAFLACFFDSHFLYDNASRHNYQHTYSEMGASLRQLKIWWLDDGDSVDIGLGDDEF